MPIPGAKWVKLGFLAGFAALIWVFSLFPAVVEQFYTYGMYPPVARFFRMITGWCPFSIGDIFYVCFCIWMIASVVRALIRIFRTRFSYGEWLSTLYRLTRFFLWSYIVFKLAWGLNYNRLGIEYQLGIAKKTYSKEELIALTNRLADKVNEARRQIADTSLPEIALDAVYDEAFRAYQSVAKDYGFLEYRNRSVKTSLFTPVAEYLGFTGYYNPVSGEAQLRTDMPSILLPYVSCHEMAHQLGYASESEANFVGYLAASASTNRYFRYSVYLDMFSYARGKLISLYFLEEADYPLDSALTANLRLLDSLVTREKRLLSRPYFLRHPVYAALGLRLQSLKKADDSSARRKIRFLIDSMGMDSLALLKTDRRQKDSLLEGQAQAIRSVFEEIYGGAIIRQTQSRLDSLVIKDKQKIRQFFNRRRNAISPAVSNMYDQYLKMNRQNLGIHSYSDVLGWLLAYEKKYGRL